MRDKVFATLRDMPIKRKLMVIIMVTTTVALVLSGAGVVISDSILFRSYLERDLSTLAQIIADDSTAAVAFDDPRTETETLAALKARTHLIAACIYRQDGTTLASYKRPGTTTGCPPSTDPDGVRLLNNGMVVTRAIVLKERRIGTLTLSYDLSEIQERMRLYGATVVAVLILSTIFAFLLSSRLRDAIAIPIMQLARTATAVSTSQDYGIRAERISGDELGLLVDAFNEMLARVQSRDQELREVLLAREEALQAAQKARDSLKTTLASIGDAVISTDLEGRVVFANPVALSLLRSQEANVIGKPLDEVFPILDEFSREKRESPVVKVLKEGTIVGLANHTVLVASDGTEIPIDDSGAPIRRADGVIQGTVLVFRDVRARRRAEETSRLLASMVESSEDAIIGHDLNGFITAWNRGAERLFGYTAEEMIGRPASVLTAPGQGDEIPGVLERVRKGERVDPYHALRSTKSGAVLNMSIAISPVYNALGRITGFSKIARDITEQVRAAELLVRLNAELQRSNERLASTNEDLERFAFISSHDLQEPLRMITIYSQLLVKQHAGGAHGKAATYVSQIVDGTQRMRDLLTDLLAYTSIGGRADEPVQTVNPNLIIEHVKQNLKESIEESGAVITAGRLPIMQANEGHFIPLFQNLIGNAIKYRSEQTPHIHISAEEQNGELQFRVTDNGIGIAPEYHSKIFVAFKRLHGKNIPGTGIGLAICQRVVERYGGRIWVESEEDRGAAFVFTLPNAVLQKGAMHE